MTSSNVIEYVILKNNKEVGNFRVNLMCRFPDYAELLKYQPLSAYTISWGYDEEENQWEDKPKNLENFLSNMKCSNKWLKSYFEGTKTSEEILLELKTAQDKIYKGITDSLKKK